MAARERQRPVRSEGGMHDDYKETHPAYAMIGAARWSGGATLFQSDFVSHNFMVITIRRADLNRGLNSDYVHGSQQLVEVALTEAQWATFVSTPNIGQGVPCTLTWTLGDGYIPTIEAEETRHAQFNAEVLQDLNESIAFMQEALAQAKTKAQREPIERALKRLTDNLPFAARRFDEHAEQTIEKMKIEVNAYLTDRVMRAGLETLGASPMLELVEGQSEPETT